MGLSLTAYRDVMLLAEGERELTDDNEDEFYDTTVKAFAYQGFERSFRGLAGADQTFTSWGTPCIGGRHYDVTNSDSFRWDGGSYGGYGDFRKSLAAISGWTEYKTQEGWWEAPGAPERPFYEILWFADNEGTIGPVAAAELLADFERFRDDYVFNATMVAKDPMSRYYAEQYDDWITGLRLAENNGLIRFS